MGFDTLSKQDRSIQSTTSPGSLDICITACSPDYSPSLDILSLLSKSVSTHVVSRLMIPVFGTTHTEQWLQYIHSLTQSYRLLSHLSSPASMFKSSTGVWATLLNPRAAGLGRHQCDPISVVVEETIYPILDSDLPAERPAVIWQPVVGGQGHNQTAFETCDRNDCADGLATAGCS